ncbi:MAG: DUF192 domain-containing protein [Candidatus Omnitrophota bacterium]
MKIINLRNNAILADKAKIADSFMTRLVGLLNRMSLDKGEALILMPSNSIHSIFMRFTIDAIFLDKNGKIIGLLPSFKPFRLSPIYFNAVLTIELPESTIKLTNTKLGDPIKLEEFPI